MNSYVAGEDILVPVQLELSGEPFVPDDNLVGWSVRGHDGSVEVPSATLTGVTDSVANITVPAAANALASYALEKRTLTVKGLVDGKPFTIDAPYRIHAFLNHSVTPKQVRTFIGISDGELPDDEIDLVDAYFEFGGAAGLTTLAQALAGDEKGERAASKGILATAVIAALPGLQARISKSETDGASKVERFNIDFSDIERRALAQLDKSLVTLSGTDPVTHNLTASSSQVDPLTGL